MKYITEEDGTIIEVIEEGTRIEKLGDGDKVIRKGSYDYLNGSVQIKLNKFIRLNEEVYNNLSKHASTLFNLFKYVGFTSGVLTFQNGRKVRPKHLASILMKKRYSGSRYIEDLIKLDVIHKHKDGKTYYYTMNPYVCMKGKRITEELHEEFKNTKYRKL